MSRQPSNIPKIQWNGSSDGPPVYMPQASQSRPAPDSLPSYEEAIESDWIEADYRKDEKYSDNKSGSHHRALQHIDQEQPPCSHWSESGCKMTANARKCCSCADKRPEAESGLYSMYVDGEGWVEGATRWQYYCPSCREYFDPKAKARLLRDQCAWAEKRAQSLAEERDQRYFGLGRWIHVCSETLKSCLPD
ncbi:hypothetical protein F5Y04DRAFT_278077 [Hypomontagnella monticulosa]|nr:hypothetical protein F5Y04DRAFT_278077 [Hypomontagnella monticulosa]